MGRLIYLQIYQDIFLDDQVVNRLDSQYSLLAPRGKILDRNGNVLALDIKGYSVGIDLEKFKFEEETITFLSEMLDLMLLQIGLYLSCCPFALELQFL